MIVKIGIEVSLDEVGKYRREFFECNGVELPFEVAKKNYVERFLASKNDYIDRVENFFVNIDKNLCLFCIKGDKICQ